MSLSSPWMAVDAAEALNFGLVGTVAWASILLVRVMAWRHRGRAAAENLCAVEAGVHHIWMGIQERRECRRESVARTWVPSKANYCRYRKGPIFL